MNEQRYIFVWANNEKRLALKGRECIILARLKRNSIVVRFTDNGQEEVISGNSIRRVKESGSYEG